MGDSDQSIQAQLLGIYPHCNEILESNYDQILSDNRQQLYVKRGTNTPSYVFENPVHMESGNGSAGAGSKKNSKYRPMNMTTKDFLSAIPSFSSFSDEQLSSLELGATEVTFHKGVRK